MRLIYHVVCEETGEESEEIICEDAVINKILEFVNDHPSKGGYGYTGDKKNGETMTKIDAGKFKAQLDKIMEEEGSVEGHVIDLLLMTVAKAIEDSVTEHEAKYHMGDVK